jgi:hypothetical protein
MFFNSIRLSRFLKINIRLKYKELRSNEIFLVIFYGSKDIGFYIFIFLTVRDDSAMIFKEI